MILYLDTSFLVGVLTRESHTPRLRAWLQRQSPDSLAISDWVITEFSAALSIKFRTAQINTDERTDALGMFAQMTHEAFQILPVLRDHFRTGARFADQPAIALRAGDALHLAICAEHGATLCTLDRRLSEAAPMLGVKAITP